MPERIQLSRQKGYRKPENTVVVARPGKFGNPFAAKILGTQRGGPGEKGQATATRQMLVDDFERWLTMPLVQRTGTSGWRWCTTGGAEHYLGVPYADRARVLDNLHELAGKNLACWCPLDQPCHADVLLRLANTPEGEAHD